MRCNSVLRYAGAKSLAADHIISKFPKDLPERYVEPFAGSFAVGFEAKRRNLFKDYLYNDYDYNLFSFFYSLREGKNTIKEKLENLLDKSVEEKKELFYRYKLILNDATASITLETRAYMYYFVNRCSFSGGGLRAGFSSDAATKRFTKSSIDRLDKFHEELQGISITDYDYWTLFKSLNFSYTKCFYYLDPPYCLEKSKNNLYKGHETFRHDILAERLNTIQSKILISYNDCDIIRELYSGWIIDEYDLSYSMSNGTKGKELLIRNYDG